VGREKARENTSERRRRDVSERGKQKENVCTAKRTTQTVVAGR
jgi:hypothetical protein